jgi:hypothetical protein
MAVEDFDVAAAVADSEVAAEVSALIASRMCSGQCAATFVQKNINTRMSDTHGRWHSAWTVSYELGSCCLHSLRNGCRIAGRSRSDEDAPLAILNLSRSSHSSVPAPALRCVPTVRATVSEVHRRD